MNFHKKLHCKSFLIAKSWALPRQLILEKAEKRMIKTFRVTFNCLRKLIKTKLKLKQLVKTFLYPPPSTTQHLHVSCSHIFAMPHAKIPKAWPLNSFFFRERIFTRTQTASATKKSWESPGKEAHHLFFLSFVTYSLRLTIFQPDFLTSLFVFVWWKLIGIRMKNVGNQLVLAVWMSSMARWNFTTLLLSGLECVAGW